MQKLYLLIVMNLALWVNMYAQFETDYKPVVSSGTLPKDFVTLSAQKYEEAKSKLASKDKDSNRKEKENFLLKTNFAIDDILLSGKVLFNDPLSDYLNKVADKVLVTEPVLRKELRFYVYKSTVVNAFSTNQGIVLVTTGLLAQLENEAELAFIICHEAVHYKEKHAIKEYLEGDKIEKGKGAYRQLAMEEKLVARCAYSKEEEKESDQKGLEIFLRSQYSSRHLMGIYDVLKYAYLPFDDITFDKNFLETTYMKFPENFYKAQTLQIDTKDIHDDDSRSTHPSISSRREKTLEGIKGADDNGKSDYLVGEHDFNYVRELARFEIGRLYILHDRYEAGIYNAYLLLKKYPNNLYLKKSIGFCLAGLAQYSNGGKFHDVHFNSDSVEGKSQALFYLMFNLDSMRQGAMNVVAAAYATKLKSEYPNDQEVDELYKNLLHSLVKKQDYHYSDFTIGPPEENKAAKTDTVINTSKTIDTVKDDTGKSKYEKLREQEIVSYKKEPAKLPFLRYAFIDYIKKDWFKRDFSLMEDSVQPVVHNDGAGEDDDDSYRHRRNYFDNRIYALGLNKIVVVDPSYSRVNARKKEKYKYIESEGGQVDFTERLRLIAKRAKLEAEVLNTKNLGENEVEKLNDVAIMSDYISERLSHSSSVNMPYFERTRIKELTKKYGSDYFMWTGAISLTDKNRSNVFLIMYTSIFPVILPFTLPAMINGGQYTLYYTLVYDVNTDHIKMSNYREIKSRTRGYILNSHIYDVLNQIKSKPSKSDEKK